MFFEVMQGKVMLAAADVRIMGQRTYGECTRQSVG
jgi:hypothetical protein